MKKFVMGSLVLGLVSLSALADDTMAARGVIVKPWNGVTAIDIFEPVAAKKLYDSLNLREKEETQVPSFLFKYGPNVGCMKGINENAGAYRCTLFVNSKGEAELMNDNQR